MLSQSQPNDEIKRMLFEIYNLSEDYISENRLENYGNALSELLLKHGYNLNEIYQRINQAEWEKNQRK